MLKPLAEPSLEKHPGSGRTAFERNLLPGFARWFVDRLERLRPDYLIPAETKGARLLESVSEYARRELGAPIQVPILYRTALAYIDAETLRGSRVMVLDDAVRTGSSLARHCEHVERWGVEEVHEAICIGFVGDGHAHRAEDCYRLVEDPDLYRQYVWQLTELVRARGLPPEVDHHVFELRLPGPLPLVWGEVEAALGQWGALSVDAPAEDWGRLCGLTLHFPEFPGTIAFPTNGPVRNEGPNKIRLFPDQAGDVVYVVPVSFPSLDLEGAPQAGFPAAVARELLRGWTGREGSVGELLASLAEKRDPEAVFRMLSASAETELVCGLTNLLRAVFGSGKVAVDPQRDLFHRLYGTTVGELLAERIAMELQRADGLPASSPAAPPDAEPAIPLFLSSAVVENTRDVAEGLKDLYEKRRQSPDFQPRERVGRSLAEIAATLDGDRLLASRCVDFGLAMTTLVPYVDESRLGEGCLRVERRYRVSEANRGYPFEDMAAVYQGMGEELITYCSDYLAEHSVRFKGRNLPIAVATSLVAIMRPMLEKLELPIGVEPGQPEPAIVLRSKPQAIGPREVESAFFVLEGADAQIVPSPYFRERCEANQLRIDRWDFTESIENFLDLMMPVLDGLEEDKLGEVLGGWSMSSDRMLGLTHVQSAIEAALAAIEPPLTRMVRGQAHRRSERLSESIATIERSARSALKVLDGDWATIAEQCWPRHTKRVASLLESGAPPADASSLFEMPAALLDALGAATLLTTRLDQISARVWHGNELDDDGKLVAAIGRAVAALRRSLASLEGDDLLAKPLPQELPRVPDVAEQLLSLLGILGAFAAASVGSFRGPKGLRATYAGEDDRERCILFMDLAESFVHAIQHSPEENRKWKNLALGCAAQWGKAFGGVKPRDPEGDAIWLEFETVSAAVLCGAAIQVHAHALRSTGVAQLQWGLRMAVDVGRIRNGEDGNAIGLALDRPATLAKKVKDEDSIERVLVTPSAAERCPVTLRCEPLMSLLGEEVKLAEIDHEAALMEPWSVDCAATVASMAAHLRSLSSKVTAEFLEEPEEMLEEGEVESSQQAGAAGATGE
jgi:hypothetical protein